MELIVNFAYNLGVGGWFLGDLISNGNEASSVETYIAVLSGSYMRADRSRKLEQ